MTMNIISSSEDVCTVTISYGSNDDVSQKTTSTRNRTRSPSPTCIREQLELQNDNNQSRRTIFSSFFRGGSNKQQKLEQQLQKQPVIVATPAPKPKKPSRKVRFVDDDENTIREIEHVHEITLEERRTRWFNRQEFSVIKLQYNLIAKKMNNSVCKFMHNEDDEIIVDQYDANGLISQPCDPNNETNFAKKDCTRGLEHKTREGSRRRSFNKHNALDAVLLEQQRQILKYTQDNASSLFTVTDDKAIADVYMNEAKTAKESALVLAARDARFAEKYAKQPITSSTSSPHTMAALNNNIEHFFFSSTEKQQDDLLDTSVRRINVCNTAIQVTPKIVSSIA